MGLNPYTLSMVIVIISVIVSVVMLYLWKIHSHIRGLAYWAVSASLAAVGFLLFPILGNGYGVFVNTSAALSATLLLLVGVLQFRGFDQNSDRKPWVIAVILGFVTLSWFTQNNAMLRSLLHDPLFMIMLVLTTFFLLYRSNRWERIPLFMTAIAALMLAAGCWYRFRLAMSGELLSGVNPGIQGTIFLGVIVYIVGWAYGLTLATSARVNRMEIDARKDLHVSQQLLQSRLNLMEFSVTRPLKETLQRALDEACGLTQSSIGFYHFVDADEKSLTLMAWSTRTLQEFCKAEGENMHYSVDHAGVWADCVRQRKPIIHNDYESLSHRKGMPDGHAAVTRELVVPIMREGRIVAILGVGNKPQDYSEKDVDIITHFADVAWEVAERKQAEAKLVEYTTELELREVEMDRLYNELDIEMQNARKAHQRLVQQRLPKPNGISLAAFHSPATYIGGDFFHAIEKDEMLILYMTDITGHGLEATIFGLFVKERIESYIDLVPKSEITPDRILTNLNQQVHKGRYPSEYAVAIFLMIVNVETRDTVFSAAGFQNPPVLVHGDGSTDMLVNQGLPISPDIPSEFMEFEHHTASIPERAFLFLAMLVGKLVYNEKGNRVSLLLEG